MIEEWHQLAKNAYKIKQKIKVQGSKAIKIHKYKSKGALITPKYC